MIWAGGEDSSASSRLDCRKSSRFEARPDVGHAEAREWLTKMPYAETRAEAERLKHGFQAWGAWQRRAAGFRRTGSGW
jgi:hypothetical protein